MEYFFLLFFWLELINRNIFLGRMQGTYPSVKACFLPTPPPPHLILR